MNDLTIEWVEKAEGDFATLRRTKKKRSGLFSLHQLRENFCGRCCIP